MNEHHLNYVHFVHFTLQFSLQLTGVQSKSFHACIKRMDCEIYEGRSTDELKLKVKTRQHSVFQCLPKNFIKTLAK